MEQQKKRTDYMRNYMKEYIKKQSKIICNECNGVFLKHRKYIHDQGKKHIYISNLKKQEQTTQ